jgi:hypothetical protein
VNAGDGFTPVDGKSALEQVLVAPAHMCIDSRDRLYLVEAGTTRLRSLTGNGGLGVPFDLPRIPTRVRRIDLRDARRPIQTIAGPGGFVLKAATGDDSPGLPFGLLVDKEGRLVLADTLYNQIKLVPAEGLN